MANWKYLLLVGLMVGLLVSGCGGEDTAVSTPDTTLTQNFGNIVSASGKVMPVKWAALSFESGGRLDWLIEEGSVVEAGAELARLEATNLELAVVQAEAALAAAEAQLALALAGARAEEIASAEGAVLIAQGNVAVAESRLAQAESGSGFAVETAEASLSQAEGNLAAAQGELSRTVAELNRLQAGARPEEIAMYQALLNQAESQFLIAENTHFVNFIDNGVGGWPEEQARYARESARGARDAAQAQLNLAAAGAATQDIAAAQAMVSVAQGQVTVAEAGVTAAEVGVAQAETAVADVAVAEAQLQIAQGQFVQADAQLSRLQAGATAEEIAGLEAQVAQAEAALAQAKTALNRATLRAPFAGTVGIVYLNQGESVVPGTSVLVVGDVSALRVETTDLNEVDATQVGLESVVTLSFDALPGSTIEGEIVRISPMASSGQGGTNFTAVIEMMDPPETLRWGMTAFVDIEIE
jgi:multidrug efflux pump subunit AcrA (membrane-fusion protein)